eukprot:gene20174-22149_t
MAVANQKLERKPANYVAGIAFCFVLFLSAFFGSIFLMGPAIPLLFINEKLFRRYNDYIVQSWLIYPGALMEQLFGTKIILYGDKIPRDESAVIIMNHRCRLDWMFYWMVLLRNGRLDHEKIIMRDDLKCLPGAGWAMQNVMYIFLCRKWEKDRDYLTKVFNYYLDIKYPLQILIFPEGTNYCKSGKEKSDAFAKKNNLELYEYVLHPRVRGFNFIIDKLRDHNLDAVHDVTVGYKNGFCYGEMDLASGKFPGEIHVYIERHNIKSLPRDSDSIDNWCVQRWSEKEKRLEKFYAQGKFDEGSCRLDGTKLYQEESAQLKMKFVLVFWPLFLCAVFYALWHFWLSRWFAVVVCFYHVVQLVVFGGTDAFQLYLHERRKHANAGQNKTL